MTDTVKPPEKIYAIFGKHGLHTTNIREISLDPFEDACEYEIAKTLDDYSDNELQAEIKLMQAEITRRKVQDDEITILARQICADTYNYSGSGLKADFITGNRDNTPPMRITKAGIIAGMELQKGREA